MSERTWTAEPWCAPSAGIYQGQIIDREARAPGGGRPAMVATTGTAEIGHSRERAGLPRHNSADCARIVACINAMAGIDDPAGLRAALDRLLAENERLREACESAYAFINSRGGNGCKIELCELRAALGGKAGGV